MLRAGSFVISGVQRLKNFIVRAQASGSEVRGVTILYDQATEGIMATVATATAERVSRLSRRQSSRRCQ
mgnify:CR=1 FL=1